MATVLQKQSWADMTDDLSEPAMDFPAEKKRPPARAWTNPQATLRRIDNKRVEPNNSKNPITELEDLLAKMNDAREADKKRHDDELNYWMKIAQKAQQDKKASDVAHEQTITQLKARIAELENEWANTNKSNGKIAELEEALKIAVETSEGLAAKLNEREKDYERLEKANEATVLCLRGLKDNKQGMETIITNLNKENDKLILAKSELVFECTLLHRQYEETKRELHTMIKKQGVAEYILNAPSNNDGTPGSVVMDSKITPAADDNTKKKKKKKNKSKSVH